jgi:hypothetical protein
MRMYILNVLLFDFSLFLNGKMRERLNYSLCGTVSTQALLKITVLSLLDVVG